MMSATSLPPAALPSAAQPVDDSSHHTTTATTTGDASVIDESLFLKTLTLLALRVPAPLCSRIMAALRPTSLLFTHSKLPTIVDEQPVAQQQQQSRPRTKLVLLSPTLDSTAAFPAQLTSLVAEHSLTTTHHTVQLTYQLHSLDEVLSVLLPAGVSPPSSFETVGHLAHLNLLPCHLPYRRLIGGAIVSHSPGIRCVVNKLSAISDEYRVLPMEVIAGRDSDTLTEVREHGCHFRFDYRLVYWNSRLATEHKRVVDLIQPHDTVIDMFAGIGPFVIPAAKKHTGDAQHILANDKNIHSYNALNDNIQLNGVDGKVSAFNLDAREFIAAVKQQLSDGQLARVDHIIMNLPATAVTFLDCLRGIHAHFATPPPPQQQKEARVPPAAPLAPPCPLVHVYTFSNADDKVADVMKRIETAIQHTLPPPAVTTDMRRSNGSAGGAGEAAAAGPVHVAASGSVRPLSAGDRKRKREGKQHAAHLLSQQATWDKPLVHFVRNVAPNKDMLCVSFRLPDSVAFGTANKAEVSEIN